MNVVVVSTILLAVCIGVILFVGPDIWSDVKGIKEDLREQYVPEPLKPIVMKIDVDETTDTNDKDDEE